MPYGTIALIACAVLVAYFNFSSKASWIARAVVSGLFIFCWASFYGWIAVKPLIALFLLVALGIFIVFYRIVEQTRSGK